MIITKGRLDLGCDGESKTFSAVDIGLRLDVYSPSITESGKRSYAHGYNGVISAVIYFLQEECSKRNHQERWS